MGASTTLSQAVLSRALAVAAPGAVLVAQLYPLVNVGNVRVTYNWLYSALNCDPNDGSTFAWVLNKTPSGAVTLSPQDQYGGMTLYASVRPDWSDFVQVQAPFSADWITGVGGDELLTMTDLGFLTANFQGVNGQYLAVNSGQTQHDDHSGYKLQSTASAPSTSTNVFLAVRQTLQAAVEVPLAADLSTDEIRDALVALGAVDGARLAETIKAATV